MLIKEIYYRFNTEDFDKSILKERNVNLSSKEKAFLIRKINTDKLSDCLKAIVLYALWSPDEAIEQARMKGIFRFDQFTLNRDKDVYYLLNYLLAKNSILKFSEETQNYIETKIQMIKEYRSNMGQ